MDFGQEKKNGEGSRFLSPGGAEIGHLLPTGRIAAGYRRCHLSRSSD